MLPPHSLYSLLPLSPHGLGRFKQSGFIRCWELLLLEIMWMLLALRPMVPPSWVYWNQKNLPSCSHALCRGRRQKLRNRSSKLTVRNSNASSDIKEVSLFLCFLLLSEYCRLWVSDFEGNLSNAMQLLYLLFTFTDDNKLWRACKQIRGQN